MDEQKWIGERFESMRMKEAGNYFAGLEFETPKFDSLAETYYQLENRNEIEPVNRSQYFFGLSQDQPTQQFSTSKKSKPKKNRK